MYCRNCGNKLDKNDKFCGKCGTSIILPSNNVVNTNNKIAETSTDKILYGVVGLMEPIVGFILVFLSKKDKPESAKICLITSTIRLVLTLIWISIWFFIYFNIFDII